VSDTALEGTVVLLHRGFVMTLAERAKEKVVCGGVLNILTGLKLRIHVHPPPANFFYFVNRPDLEHV
jgi:hypothetical protein